MQGKSLPLCYVFSVTLGLTGGLVAVTNSFLLDDLSRYSLHEGMALGLSIGEVEMLGYILNMAATANLGIYWRQSWLKWDHKFVRAQNWRDLQVSSVEVLCLVTGIVLVIIASYRETVMAMSL